MLEVCVDSLESAINAIENGADELEVCSCLSEGGLTPSPGLVHGVVREVKKYMKNNKVGYLQKPKVNVMIRCRAGADFCYSDLEMRTMLDDIDCFKLMDVDRFVFGGLTDKQQIDDIHCSKILAQAFPLPVTFNRAFDVCIEPKSALQEIAQLGFTRVLTSGRMPSAFDSQAVAFIREMLKISGDKIEVMPGSGVNSFNVKTFIDMGCKIVHSSCKKLQHVPVIANELEMGSKYVYVTDGNMVRQMKDVIRS